MSGGEFIRDDVIKQMAAEFPAAQRKEAAVMFTQIISLFNDNVEKLYGVPKENVAIGLVEAISGALCDANGQPVGPLLETTARTVWKQQAGPTQTLPKGSGDRHAAANSAAAGGQNKQAR